MVGNNTPRPPVPHVENSPLQSFPSLVEKQLLTDLTTQESIVTITEGQDYSEIGPVGLDWHMKGNTAAKRNAHEHKI